MHVRRLIFVGVVEISARVMDARRIKEIETWVGYAHNRDPVRPALERRFDPCAYSFLDYDPPPG